jgi:hypothetical protein
MRFPGKYHRLSMTVALKGLFVNTFLSFEFFFVCFMVKNTTLVISPSPTAESTPTISPARIFSPGAAPSVKKPPTGNLFWSLTAVSGCFSHKILFDKPRAEFRRVV